MHDFFVAGGAFKWCLPKINWKLRSADRSLTTVRLNRYPHNVIGIAAYVRGRGIGLRWKSS